VVRPSNGFAGVSRRLRNILENHDGDAWPLLIDEWIGGKSSIETGGIDDGFAGKLGPLAVVPLVDPSAVAAAGTVPG
jgi:hypothetical protein